MGRVGKPVKVGVFGHERGIAAGLAHRLGNALIAKIVGHGPAQLLAHGSTDV